MEFLCKTWALLYHRERIWKSSTLSCMKKRRKSPNLPQDEGAPPLFLGALSRWGRAPIIMRARTHYFGCSPKPTSTHPLSKSPPSYLPATSADPPSTPIPRSGGDHTPLHPLLTSNPPLRPRGLGTVGGGRFGKWMGACWFWRAPKIMGARPHKMGARPHSERAPKNNGGAPSSCGRFGDFLLFFIAAKSWWF